MTTAHATVAPGRVASLRRSAAPRLGPSRLGLVALHLRARIARWSRWEFWPALVVYAPLVPYIAWLALRHRSLTVCTAANPCMPLGGIVGESKGSVLCRLPAGAGVPTALVPPGPHADRLAAIDEARRRLNTDYPMVLKPDVGERGAGVCLIRDQRAAAHYLAGEPRAILVQAYHHGPYEAGIFYVRHPREARGSIFSITDKRFPAVVGDGSSTLRELVLRHDRCRLQANLFLGRLGARADAIPPFATPVSLNFAGNHCQGTMFLDGAALITPELTAAVDAIAQQVPGFFFGRFDVRYADRAEFAAGRGFAVLELNGLLSESTNIYDPSVGFWQGQRTLRSQWRHAFEIGAANSRAGAPVASPWACVRTVVSHLRRTKSS